MTEIDFTNCHSKGFNYQNLYGYTIDTSTGMPFPAADGRSPYQDDVGTEEYSKFYAFAHAIFTSCWASPYCTMLANWGTFGKQKQSNSAKTTLTVACRPARSQISGAGDRSRISTKTSCGTRTTLPSS